MFGNPITVQEWNRKYSTLNGRLIVKELLYFHEHPLELKEPEKGIDEEVDSALAAVGIQTDEHRYVALSLRKFSESLLVNPPEKKKKIIAEARTSFRVAARRNLDALCRKANHFPMNSSRKESGMLYDELTESLGNSLQVGMYRSIEKELSAGIGTELRDEMCKLLYDAAYHGLFNLIFYQVSFLIHGELARARNTARLIGFFRRGFYPCGVFSGMHSGMKNGHIFLNLVA